MDVEAVGPEAALCARAGAEAKGMLWGSWGLPADQALPGQSWG